MPVHHATSYQPKGKVRQPKPDALGEVLISLSNLESRLMPMIEYVQRMYGADPRKDYYPFDINGGTAIYCGRKRLGVLPPDLGVVHFPGVLGLSEGDYIGAKDLVCQAEQQLASMSALAANVGLLAKEGA